MIRVFLRSRAEFIVKSVCPICDTRVSGTVSMNKYWNAAKVTSYCGEKELDFDDPARYSMTGDEETLQVSHLRVSSSTVRATEAANQHRSSAGSGAVSPGTEPDPGPLWGRPRSAPALGRWDCSR